MLAPGGPSTDAVMGTPTSFLTISEAANSTMRSCWKRSKEVFLSVAGVSLPGVEELPPGRTRTLRVDAVPGDLPPVRLRAPRMAGRGAVRVRLPGSRLLEELAR